MLQFSTIHMNQLCYRFPNWVGLGESFANHSPFYGTSKYGQVIPKPLGWLVNETSVVLKFVVLYP